ncbi:Guanine nucleotide exchange factor LTE1 [Cladobotryum mycophilum]|uniref:Guanine nucleotide exchange factor LTE1 n=1 Tax=Cladobotryum mycophilum TaxID=491253 RepID=A0ABR0SYR6_9HYPO
MGMEAVEPIFSTARPSYDFRSLPSSKRRNVPSLFKTSTPPQGVMTPKDAKLKRVSPSAGGLDGKDSPPPPKSAAKMTRKGSTAGQPLVPWTERMSHDERIVSIGKRDGNSDRWDLAPDGASAGREGRQFTVANVGNNGRIYLRPSVRPAHQRYPQPSFTFPVTPPGTSGVEVANPDKLQVPLKPTEHHDSQYTPTPRTSTAVGGPSLFLDPNNPTRSTKHRRAMSDSTIHELAPSKEPDTDGYRVVISKPGAGDDKRPKTMDDLSTAGAPILNIHIPSWRLGTPRFTLKGTPVIRGSSYAPTEDFRSSSASILNRAHRNLNSTLPNLGPGRLSHLAIPQARFPRVSQTHSLRLLRPMRSTYMSTHLVIEPEMFTDLTFKPACDDKAIVRYSPAGAVTAATAPRLVAEITSPSFLDYELISDFFLTFRSFLEPEILLRMLIARLRWALERTDETGMIVRVRTFVAIRHWILNYFIDDFVLDYGLRVTFCMLLNDFVDELAQDAKVRKVQLKILGELKKCWRRICAHYWDGPDFDDSLGVDAPIAPGGIVGNRDPSLDPSFWEREGIEPQLDNLSPFATSDAASFNAEPSRNTTFGDFLVLGHRLGTPDNQKDDNVVSRNEPRSPLSIGSMDIVSCSFPSKSTKLLTPNSNPPMTAHPIFSTSPKLQPGPIATTPKTLAGKRVRPAQTHLRNNSISDSLREHSSDKSSSNDVEFAMTLQSAGSLVRGNLLPPGQPFVDIEPDTHNGESNRQTTIVQPQSRGFSRDRILGGAMSGSGMKKLIGSVRRALSSRGPWLSPSQPNFTGFSPVNNQGISTDQVPGTVVDPQGSGSRQHGARQLMRIDLLGAEIAEDFKKAIREEEAAAEAERLGIPIPPKSAPAIPGPQDYSAAHMDSSTFDCLPQNQKQRPVSDMGITIGSKSIVIVDDTVPFELPGMHGGVPSFSPSAEALADSFLHTGGDLTPPTTPPAQGTLGTPRRLEPTFILYTSSRPPCSSSYQRGLLRLHRRNRSTKSHRSINSILRRHASFASGISRQSTAQNLDDNTESSDFDHYIGAQESEPMHTLRRRPGGDLRAATNVGEIDDPILRPSRSAGSLTTYTESIRSSYLLGTRPATNVLADAAVEDASRSERKAVFSVGQMTEKPIKNELSLISTHSSKPVMRPSFEHEAQRLAAISDDEDDGGIESALLKLEGRYRPRRKLSSTEHLISVTADPQDETPSEVNIAAIFSSTEHQVEVDTQHLQPHERALWLLEGESYCSIPLLDRGLTDDGRSKRTTTVWTDRSVFRGSDGEASDQDDKGENHYGPTETGHFSYDFVEKTNSLERIETGQTVTIGVEDQSFLDDASVAGSDLSSELSVDGHGHDNIDGSGGFFTLPLRAAPPHPPHPFGEPVALPRSNSPSAAMTLTQALGMVPERELYPEQIWATKPLPLTPEIPPMASSLLESQSPSYESPLASGILHSPRKETEHCRKYSVHLPFILAFDSDILAQQFTLIEKDALNDIDWKDLIEMNWKDSTISDSRSWVDFLRNSDAHGVEVVIARFNIMVKWAISEIVLTQHIEERARCIVKFIHIAAHCRRYRNFATMAQLTMALTSNEISRLSRTWELIPDHDLKTLGDLEGLVTPTRNFYNLRAEMETGSDGGCIPFRLLAPLQPPLINFERYRIGAAVVKTLLRLLEASTRYTFQPIEGITERCLWMGALSDDEIRRHSESLE